MMDKMLNRYFDKVVESEFNQQRMRSEQWRQKRTMFDSYMNLSPAERRRVSVFDMRGYQIQRIDNENVLLYSFEDNVVYNAKIDKQFNKIIVQSVNHKFSDMEKRAVFDNPFGYEPVSPYCIIFPTTQAGELQIMNLPGDLGNNINEMKNTAETISNAAQQMGDDINTFAQQTATIYNDFADLREYSDSERAYLLYDLNGDVHRVLRSGPMYKTLIHRKYVEDGGWLVKHESHPLNISSEIYREKEVVPLHLETTGAPLITKLNKVITMMKSFDIQVNLGNMYEAINLVVERINFLEDEKKACPMMLKLLENLNAKLENTNQEIKLLSIQYAEVTRSIATGDETLTQIIGNLVNQQKAVIEESDKHLKTVETRLQGIENKPDPPAIADIEALIPRQSEEGTPSPMRIDELMNFMKEQYNDIMKQWIEQNSFIQQFVSAEL